jgi:methionyl-tRNA formyltransferase
MIKNIVFMGTPDFAVPSLKHLIKQGLKPVLVVSQTDKPKGRNLVLQPTPVKAIALENYIKVFQPENVNSQESIDYIKSYNPDIIITVAFGAFLNSQFRKMCPSGAINLHPSLLPLHRGADPVRNTLLNGETDCGISVFFITAKMDNGPIILQKKYAINDLIPKINHTLLEEKLSHIGSEVLFEAIQLLNNQKKQYNDLKQLFPPQDHNTATYSQKLEKHHLIADFNLSTTDFINKVQAYADEPGYYCYFRGKRLKIFEAECMAQNNPHQKENPATITQNIKKQGFTITLKDNDLLIKEVQYEGKNRMNAYEFAIGSRLEIGEKLTHVP